MKTIEIAKRASDKLNAIACWRVNAEGAAPNTEINNSARLTLIITIDGKRLPPVSSNSFTLFSLTNPGKKTKLLGGSKEYDKVEIVAIDQSTEFVAEWGFGGPTAIPVIDRKLGGVECTAVAFGFYNFEITDYFSFFSTIAFNDDGEIPRAAIRDFVRDEVSGIIQSSLAAELAKADLDVCRGKMNEYGRDIMRIMNKNLESKGITVKNFTFKRLDYDPAHLEVRKGFDDAKLDVERKKITNEGNRDDISVQDAAADVQVKLIDAHGRAGKNIDKEIPLQVIFCPRCGTKNEDSRFCKKCGEKLIAPTEN